LTVEHIPVLMGTLAEQITLPPDGIMVDATIGQGGHSYLLGKSLGPKGLVIGLDIDDKAIENARKRLKDLTCKVVLVRTNFSEIDQRVAEQGVDKVDFVLADLGVSSAQLADDRMGLSFQKDMPLDMRIDKRLTTTAADIVNKEDEKTLADLIYRFGQDRASRRIARFIVKKRAEKPIFTTGQLADIVCSALSKPGQKRRRRLHPTTRTFQALRIVVNNELENLKEFLAVVPQLLKKNARVAVISFHSLEDGLVKRDFRQNEKKGIYSVITHKPIIPTRDEITVNPRARSAKLRIAMRN
jgi:16S rRNA (cytosine1402-N4)-methyltransferase